MFNLIKIFLMGTFVAILSVNFALANNCQNNKITEIKEIEFSSGLSPVHGDINADGYPDKLMYNLYGDWVVLEFYVENEAWRSCDPNFVLKLISSKQIEARGREFVTVINKKGSIRIASCYYGGTRGACHDDYNLVLRYNGKNLQIIGYDHGAVGITYPSIAFSINLLTGRSTVIQSPGMLQETKDELRDTHRKTLNLQYSEHYLNDGEVILVPNELLKATDLLFAELNK